MKYLDDLRPRTVCELMGDDSPLLTRSAAEIIPLRRKLPPMKWWLVDEFRNVLVPKEDIDDDYELELDDIDDKELSRALEQVVGWIYHIGGKAWANPEMVGEMAIFLSRRVICRMWARTK